MRGTASLSLALGLLASAVASTARADEPPPPVAAPAPAPAPNDGPGFEAALPSSRDPVAPLPPVDDCPPNPVLRKTVAERRGGVVLGLSPGIAFAGSSGYPNDVKLIGNPDFYSHSPLLVGTSTTIFLMGAFTDYLSFGPMVNTAQFTNDKWKSTGIGVGFRLEAFPLLRAAPAFADSSIYGQAGIGSTELQAKGNYPSADGTQSFLGLGLHHEFRLFRAGGGHFAGGPYVEYDTIFADSVERHWVAIGFRLAWYGGTVVADHR